MYQTRSYLAIYCMGLHAEYRIIPFLYATATMPVRCSSAPLIAIYSITICWCSHAAIFFVQKYHLCITLIPGLKDSRHTSTTDCWHPQAPALCNTRLMISDALLQRRLWKTERIHWWDITEPKSKGHPCHSGIPSFRCISKSNLFFEAQGRYFGKTSDSESLDLNKLLKLTLIRITFGCLHFAFSVYTLYNVNDRSQVCQAIAEFSNSELKNEYEN